MSVAALVGAVVAGLGLVVFASLWVLTELGLVEDLRLVRHAQRLAGFALFAILLALPSAYMWGAERYAEWKTEQIMDQVNEMQERYWKRLEVTSITMPTDQVNGG